MSKFLDENGLLYLWNKIKGKLSEKVDKEDGKGLSSNDFTNEEKQKLDALSIDSLGGLTEADADARYLQLSGGTMTGDVNFSDHSLTGVKDPVNDTDAANKQYVDNALTDVKEPTGENDVTSKKYVDDEISSATEETKKYVDDAISSATPEWSSIQNKPDVALKSDLTQVYRYKGSVANYASLPMTDNEVGDVWNVEASGGMNYAWTGEAWDALGETFQIDTITNTDIDDIINEE